MVATQGSVGLGALLHNFFRVTEGNVFFKFGLSYFFSFGPFWEISRVGAVIAGTVGAAWGFSLSASWCPSWPHFAQTALRLQVVLP